MIQLMQASLCRFLDMISIPRPPYYPSSLDILDADLDLDTSIDHALEGPRFRDLRGIKNQSNQQNLPFSMNQYESYQQFNSIRTVRPSP